MSACVHTPTSRSRYGSVADIASPGGPQSVRTIIRPLPRSLPVPIIVFQHLASHRARGASRFLESVATIHGQRSSAVILTGSGSDGSSGAIPVSAAEGTVFVQAAETCSSAHRPSLQCWWCRRSHLVVRRNCHRHRGTGYRTGSCGASHRHSSGGLSRAGACARCRGRRSTPASSSEYVVGAHDVGEARLGG